jgi:hypothetical protein
MLKKLLSLFLTTSVVACFAGGSKWIARVAENGDIIFDRTAYFTPDVREVEISEADGSIYISTEGSGGFAKFDENGYLDPGFDLPAMHSTNGFDISYADYLWITGSEVVSDFGLYKYTSDGDYVDGIEDFKPVDSTYDFSENEAWACVDDPHDYVMPGVHKFTDSVSRIFYIPGYQPGYIDSDAITGSAWFIDAYLGLVKMTVDGTEEFVNHAIDHPLDPQASNVDGGCWFFDCYTGDLYKVDTFGSIVFHDDSFSDIAAIDVNESDGSVWVASNIPKRLVHLDKDGKRMLYKQWPGGDFAHLAVDQRNATCIVIYEEYKSGRSDVNIQPASVGEIKAMYAE